MSGAESAVAVASSSARLYFPAAAVGVGASTSCLCRRCDGSLVIPVSERAASCFSGREGKGLNGNRQWMDIYRSEVTAMVK